MLMQICRECLKVEKSDYMTRFKYTKEQIDYVRKIAKGRYNDEITEMFNKKFGLNKTVQQINALKKNHGITSGKLPKRYGKNRLLTPEQEQFVRDHAKGLYNQELADLVNETFGTNFTALQMSTWKNNHGVSSGLTGYFEKGKEPWNKGLKGLNIGGKETQFKKGQRPLNYRPVGSERIDSKDGYVLVKVQDKGSWPERWRFKHVVLWEKYHGKLPKDHVIVFLDQNKLNLNLDNLTMISRAELAIMNKYNLFSDDPEITKVGITLAKLMLRSSELEFKDGDAEKFKEYIKMAEKNGIKEATFIQRVKRGWTLEQAAKLPLHTKIKRGDNRAV